MVIGILVTTIGIASNLLLFAFLFLTKTGRKLLPQDVHYVFLGILNVTDLVFSIKIFVFIMIGFGTGEYLDHKSCWAYATLAVVTGTVSYGLLVLLSLERYYKVVRLQHRTWRFWLLISIPCFLVGFGIPVVIYVSNLHHVYWTLWDGIGYCMVRYNSRDPIHIVISLIHSTYLGSSQVILVYTNYYLIRQVTGVKTALLDVIRTTINPAQSYRFAAAATAS
ncbi:hypothetical protein HK102_011982, partial [Quaeritorhiza haematococci]